MSLLARLGCGQGISYKSASNSHVCALEILLKLFELSNLLFFFGDLLEGLALRFQDSWLEESAPIEGHSS